VLAELCRTKGLEVTLVTPAPMVSAWTVNTLEALPIAKRIAKLGIGVITYTSVTGFDGGKLQLANGLTGVGSELRAAALVTVTARLPTDGLFEELRASGHKSITRVGDCLAPSTIQQAVYSGHKWARELDEAPELLIPRELPMIESMKAR